jgi:hypothetical protein
MRMPRSRPSDGLWASFINGNRLGRASYVVLVAGLLFYSGVAVFVSAVLLRPFHESLAAGPSSDSKAINFIEVIYFLTNSFVAAATIVALFFARVQIRHLRKQNREATRARKAEMYLDISKQWDSSKIVKARNDLYELDEFFEKHKTRILGQNINDRADYFRYVLTAAEKHDDIYTAYIAVSSFTEDIGLLCRRKYVRLKDINDIIGDGLRETIGMVIGQIVAERRQDGAQSYYAQTLWLYERLNKMSSFSVEGYGAPP